RSSHKGRRRQDDTFSSPRAAAERLQELRRVEATEAQKARAAAAMFETKDLNLGKSAAQIEEEFAARAPKWVVDAGNEGRELWKAQLKEAGDLPSVKVIEQYEEDYADAERRERAEQQAVTQEPVAPPQPQPDALEAERAALAAREQQLAGMAQLS